MNEAGVSQNIGIIMLDAFFLVSGVAYVMMGSFQKAVDVAARHTPTAAEFQSGEGRTNHSDDSATEAETPKLTLN